MNWIKTHEQFILTVIGIIGVSTFVAVADMLYKHFRPIIIRVHDSGYATLNTRLNRIEIRVDKVDLTVKDEKRKFPTELLESKSDKSKYFGYRGENGIYPLLKKCYKHQDREENWIFNTIFKNEQELKEYLTNNTLARIRIGRIKSNWFQCNPFDVETI